MKNEENDKVISFDKELTELELGLKNADPVLNRTAQTLSENEKLLADILADLQQMSGMDVPALQKTEEEQVSEELASLNILLDEVSDPRYLGDIQLRPTDFFVSVSAGVVASVIDIVFVGTPEVVKIYRGGENFDGSILTALFRKLGNDESNGSVILKWLSDNMKVSYDISALKNVVNPNNHRLRCFAHDPLLGLLFAVADIIMGTATLVDEKGKLRVIVRPKEYPVWQKYLSVLYYLGHLISDVCTARGLPIPGFVLTQFFTDGEDASLARIAEQMYLDGYDLRHLASMSTAVWVKNLIIDLYLRFFVRQKTDLVLSLAKKQIEENKNSVYKYKLRLISDAVACGGNVLKFFIPPTSGNITALNMPEWTSLIKNTIISAKYDLRDKSVEKVLFEREIIDGNWEKLMV